MWRVECCRLKDLIAQSLVKKSVASKLMKADSAKVFLRASRRVDWRTFASLKLDVDGLVHSDLNAAARLVERIDQLAELTDEPRSRAFARASRARWLHLLGRHSEANPLYEDAIKALISFKLPLEAAILQKQQVDALTHLGRYDEALKLARTARIILSRADRVQLAQLETNVGNIYYMLDRYKKALAHYDLAHVALSAGKHSKMRALVDLNRANVFTELDQPDQALSLLSNAARAFDRGRQYVLAAQARYHIAYLEFLRGHYNAGLKGYYQTRDRLSGLGSEHLVAWCDLEIAEILHSLNAFDEALQHSSKAHDRFAELIMPYEAAKSQMVSGLAAMGLGQFELAHSLLVAARELFVSNKNTTFASTADSYLAELALRSGNARDATRHAERALRTFVGQRLISKAAYARLLTARAAYLVGDSARARRMAIATLRSIENRFAPTVEHMCHHLLGRIERDRGNGRGALTSFRRSVDIVEEMRGRIAADEFKASFFADKMEVYEDAIRACLDESNDRSLDEAFRLVESAKSRGLADLLASYLRETPAQRSEQNATGTRDRLLKLIEELNWHSAHAHIEDEKGEQRRAAASDRYGREVNRCERQISQLFRRLEAEGAGETLMRMRAINPVELQQSLEQDETAIEYFTTGDEISAFVVTQSSIDVVRAFASKRDVERALVPLRFQIEKFNYGTVYADNYFEQLNRSANQHLGLLCRTLFSPLERYARGHRLILVPHSALHYVPFHALLNRKGYLIDQFEISYSPSATVLNLCRNLEKRTRSNSRKSDGSIDLVALGVTADDTPEVASEIEALSAMFPNAMKLTGANATRDNLLRAAPKAGYLHLASHGCFRRDNPMFSFLKLADSNLNFYSLLDLKLNARMVTLSACHTGVNKVFPGDELHGLMRGFLYAGAPSLVASLWATSDRSTSVLMKQMYSELRSGSSKRAALRSAQLAVKEEYGHPYYWAPFILMGSPN
jgi:CHAT domain-containing protein